MHTYRVYFFDGATTQVQARTPNEAMLLANAAQGRSDAVHAERIE